MLYTGGGTPPTHDDITATTGATVQERSSGEVSLMDYRSKARSAYWKKVRMQGDGRAFLGSKGSHGGRIAAINPARVLKCSDLDSCESGSKSGNIGTGIESPGQLGPMSLERESTTLRESNSAPPRGHDSLGPKDLSETLPPSQAEASGDFSRIDPSLSTSHDAVEDDANINTMQTSASVSAPTNAAIPEENDDAMISNLDVGGGDGDVRGEGDSNPSATPLSSSPSPSPSEDGSLNTASQLLEEDSGVEATGGGGAGGSSNTPDSDSGRDRALHDPLLGTDPTGIPRERLHIPHSPEEGIVSSQRTDTQPAGEADLDDVAASLKTSTPPHNVHTPTSNAKQNSVPDSLPAKSSSEPPINASSPSENGTVVDSVFNATRASQNASVEESEFGTNAGVSGVGNRSLESDFGTGNETVNISGTPAEIEVGVNGSGPGFQNQTELAPDGKTENQNGTGLQSGSGGTGSPLPSQQKEKSVFLRLSNHIADLQTNMTLFSIFLDQISSR